MVSTSSRGSALRLVAAADRDNALLQREGGGEFALDVAWQLLQRHRHLAVFQLGDQGLSETRVLLGHALRNAALPTLTLMGVQFGFLFGGSDLATAKQFGINLVTVVVNNASYGNVLRDQQRLYEGRHSGAVLTNPDFQAYARAFGVGAWRVETADAFRGALKEALASDAPALIEVMSDIAKDYPPYRFHQPRLP